MKTNPTRRLELNRSKPRRSRDFLSVPERSQRMSLIKDRGTKPELEMARLLRRARLRYRGHVKNLPGCPDFVILGAAVVIFVDGEFWHGRWFDSWKEKLSHYWLTKIAGNIRRDKRNHAKLRRAGWAVIRIWEPDLQKRPGWCLHRIERAIKKRVGKSCFLAPEASTRRYSPGSYLSRHLPC
jgi:DNA mismatch endonuclease (patch repair protein)